MSIAEETALLDGTAQADLVRRKEVKAIELVDAAIERIERVNPSLNAVVTPMYDQARKTAGGPLAEGPFAGVPYLLKDILASCAGVRMTLGASLMRDFVADHDSELVKRLKRAGLVILGKTSTPELGLLPTTEPRLFGPCRNPWDLTRTTGGSSGGSAAAVAAGMVAMAHGNDGGGIHKDPGLLLRPFRPQAHQGAKPPRPRFRGRSERSGGGARDHPIRARQRGTARLHLRTGCGGSLLGAAASPSLCGGGGR
jgi:amidase